MSTEERRLESCQLTGKSYMLFSCTILELKHHLREVSISPVVPRSDRHPRGAQHLSPLQTDLPVAALYCPARSLQGVGWGARKTHGVAGSDSPSRVREGLSSEGGMPPSEGSRGGGLHIRLSLLSESIASTLTSGRATLIPMKVGLSSSRMSAVFFSKHAFFHIAWGHRCT